MLLNKRIPIGYVLKKVRFDLCVVLALGLLVLLITNLYDKLLPEMPFTIPAFIGTAISILLSFKLNQSYDRWWEARKIWGSIVNDSRSLILQLQSFIDAGDDGVIKLVAYRQIAWCYALGQSLRGLNPLANVEKLISTEDLSTLQTQSNIPLSIIQLNCRDVSELRRKGKLDVFTHLQLDDTFVRLCDAQGRAERIKSTIFPVTYRLFLHFIIYLFIITLSISLKDVDWYFELPLLLLVAMAFFLLEKSATLMQDPFENKPTDTAVTAIARTIEINLKQLLGEEEIPAPVQPEKFYIK